jgi:hypothetical protein
MTLNDIYRSILDYKPRDNDGDALTLSEFSRTRYWEVVKHALIEPMIIDLLSQAGDMGQVLEGHMNLKQFGTKAFIARSTADKLQQLIDLVEKTHDGQ